ncbi:MAG: hypothetical protein IPM59_01605 [Chloracidobacterium sp.]|nr:hypothetical protein [Chloracidobacterium sp.]
MKRLVFVMFCVLALATSGLCQCPKNSDSQYDRENILEQFKGFLWESIPGYKKREEELGYSDLFSGFFIYDLSDPTNRFTTNKYSEGFRDCINFVNNHVYHFSAVFYPFSNSFLAVLENGRLKVFKSVNCVDSGGDFSEVVKYVENMLKNETNRKGVLIRLRNYRRYGFYRATDETRVVCNYDKEIPENSDKLYTRGKILGQLSDVLRGSVSKKVREQLSWRFLVEESRGNGFFVWDLTEPTNKQASLLERVEFKNKHIYHFAFIDLPFSFSHIAVLEDGRLKIFKSINCKGKGDRLEDVVAYVNEQLKNDKNKAEIIKRVKNYREYGSYAAFNGQSKPQCEEARE